MVHRVVPGLSKVVGPRFLQDCRGSANVKRSGRMHGYAYENSHGERSGESSIFQVIAIPHLLDSWRNCGRRLVGISRFSIHASPARRAIHPHSAHPSHQRSSNFSRLEIGGNIFEMEPSRRLFIADFGRHRNCCHPPKIICVFA